jgi:hypothetical protein
VTDKVAILSASLGQNGYVVLHKEEEGKPGKIIGMISILGSELYSNSIISLAEDVMLGDVLYAILYSDNGDAVFTAEDSPVTDDDGVVIMTKLISI